MGKPDAARLALAAEFIREEYADAENGHKGTQVLVRFESLRDCIASVLQLNRDLVSENSDLLGKLDAANLQVHALKAVAEAALNALGCCDYGCEKFSGCGHENCCPLDAKVIDALRAAGFTEKSLCEHLWSGGKMVCSRCGTVEDRYTIEKPKSEFAGCCSSCNWSHEPHDCKCHAEKRKCEHTWTETQCSTCGDPKPDYKRKCEHEWSHIEDSHFFCAKCRATADFCGACGAEYTKTRDGGLVCLKCHPQ